MFGGEGLPWRLCGHQQDILLPGLVPLSQTVKLGLGWCQGSPPASSDSILFVVVAWEVVLSSLKVTNLLLIAGNSRVAGPPSTVPLGRGEAALSLSPRLHPLLGPRRACPSC